MFNASRSPFKFLDPYDKKDIQFFFGRDKETDLLYDMVSKNRIVLVYGQSGTGKTSIIQCGLANAFDPTDWMPFFIRREENINDAVLKVLLKENIPPNENETLLIRERLFGSLNGNDSFTDYEKKIPFPFLL